MNDTSSEQIEQAVEKIRLKAAGMGPVEGRILLDCGEQNILIDGSGENVAVSVVPMAEADCQVCIKPQLLTDILAGRSDAFTAFTTGKIGINGDMNVAIQLQPMLSGD